MLGSSMVASDTDTLKAGHETRAEYEVLQSGCGLLDRSERGKLALSGAGAVEFLNGQITNELADLRPGEGRYAAFLTNKGKMLGDLRVLAVGEGAAVEELLLDTERVALQALFDMIRRYKVGYDVQLHKRTLECSLFSLIGPAAHACAAGAAGSADIDPTDPANPPILDALQEEHTHTPATVAGRRVRLIATADGIDMLCASSEHDAVRDALLEAGAGEVGEDAAEILRVERGRPRYGLDMDEGTIPQEAALNERAVSFTKGCYVGQETVARLFYRGKPNRHLRGLRISEPAHSETAHLQTARLAASGEELRLGERVVGHLGSVVESPLHGLIGLALVRRAAGPGDTLAVGERGASATVVELPFA
jgi:folate-binding protein YgfZ